PLTGRDREPRGREAAGLVRVWRITRPISPDWSERSLSFQSVLLEQPGEVVAAEAGFVGRVENDAVVARHEVLEVAALEGLEELRLGLVVGAVRGDRAERRRRARR